MQEHSDGNPIPKVLNAVAGGVSAMVSRTLTAPLSTLQLVLQTESNADRFGANAVAARGPRKAVHTALDAAREVHVR